MVWLVGVVVRKYIDFLINGEQKQAHPCPLNLQNFRYIYL